MVGSNWLRHPETRNRCSAAGVIAQNAVCDLQIGAEHFGHGNIDFRMAFQQVQEHIARQDGNVARFNAGYVDLREISRDGRAHAEYFALLSRGHGRYTFRTWDGDPDSPGI